MGGPNGTPLTEWTIYGADQARTGRAVQATLPRETPSVRWQVDLDGESDGSPVLYQKKIYTGAARSIFCLDADSGEVIWELNADNNVQSQFCLFNDRLYVGDDSGNFSALSPETGETLWSVRLNGDVRSAPVIADETIYIIDDSGGLYALKETDGTLIWSKRVFSDVAPAYINGTLYCLTSSGIAGGPSNSVVAISATDGAERWRTGVRGFAFHTPAIDGDRLLLATNGKLYALNATTGDILWDVEVPNQHEFNSSPAVSNGIVYFGCTSNGGSDVPATVYAISVSSGEQIWSSTINQDRFGIHTALVAADGLLIATGDQVGVVAFDLLDGSLVWNFTPNNGFQGASPIVSGNRIYYLDVAGDFYCLEG